MQLITQTLDPATLASFGALAAPPLRELALRPNWVLAGARDRRPRAIGLMQIQPELNAGCVVDVLAALPASAVDFARPVLSQLELEARARGCRSLIWTMPDSSSRPAIAQVLAGLDWAPGHSMRAFAFEYARMMEAPFMQIPAENEGELFPWAELTPGERSAIESSQSCRQWFPENLSPFMQEPLLDPSCSFGLRYAGRVAGWSIVTRQGGGAVYIATLFIRPDLQARGWGARMIQESIRRGFAAGLTVAAFEVERHSTAMLRFVDRRMRAHLKSASAIYRTWKMLE